MGKQVQAFFVDIIGLHLVFKVMPQFFTFTPTFNAGFLQVLKGFIEVIQCHFVAKNARCALGFTVSFACFGRKRHRGDIT